LLPNQRLSLTVVCDQFPVDQRFQIIILVLDFTREPFALIDYASLLGT